MTYTPALNPVPSPAIRPFQIWALGLASLLTLVVSGSAAPAPATVLTGASRLPIKEVTVFKDGHAFVVHQGRAAVDAAGLVTLDALPAPVIGTFWPYVADKQLKLASVEAAQRQVAVERTSLTVAELLAGNVGQEVSLTETNGQRYPATILGFPTRTTEELARTSPPNSPPQPPVRSQLVLLKTQEGTKILPLDHIQDVTFLKKPAPTVTDQEFRNLLTLKLEGARGAGKTAEVGLMYLQKGLRWIPSYKVDLDGHGKAAIQLQGTLINELADLEGAAVHLVIGVPTFQFKDTLDPMSLQQVAAQLSQYFQNDAARGGRASLLANNYGNAIMSQSARMGDYQGAVEAVPADAGEGPAAGRNEDLFVFSLRDITLRKGARLVVPLASVTVAYEDIFTAEVAFAPPQDVLRNFNNQQQLELSRLLNAPKAMHKVRLSNKTSYPFTTAPALILREGRVLAQGMMTYTAPGATSDLGLTTAVDIQVRKKDNETKRTPGAVRVGGADYLRVDLAGNLKLTNHRATKVTLEVVRHVLGNVTTADSDGQVAMSNTMESSDFLPGGDYPNWWGWYSWPYWWHHLNGMGRITWAVTLEPGKSVDLNYTWHYFWR
jgi:hypothetical protein